MIENKGIELNLKNLKALIEAIQLEKGCKVTQDETLRSMTGFYHRFTPYSYGSLWRR